MEMLCRYHWNRPVAFLAPPTDPARLEPIRECMENYDIGDPDEDWPNNELYRGKLGGDASEAFARAGSPADALADAKEQSGL